MLVYIFLTYSKSSILVVNYMFKQNLQIVKNVVVT